MRKMGSGVISMSEKSIFAFGIGTLIELTAKVRFDKRSLLELYLEAGVRNLC